MESWLEAGETWSEELVKENLSSVAERECGPWLWLGQSEEFSLELWPTGEVMEVWRCPVKGSCRVPLRCFLLGGSGGALSMLGRRQRGNNKGKTEALEFAYHWREITVFFIYR